MMFDPTLVKQLIAAVLDGTGYDVVATAQRLRATAIPWANAGQGYKRAYMRMRQRVIRAHERKRNPKVKPGLTAEQIQSIVSGRFACETAPVCARVFGCSVSTVYRYRRAAKCQTLG